VSAYLRDNIKYIRGKIYKRHDHIGRQKQQNQSYGDGFRNEGQRLFMNLRRSLENGYDKPYQHTDDKQRTREPYGKQQNLSENLQSQILGHGKNTSFGCRGGSLMNKTQLLISGKNFRMPRGGAPMNKTRSQARP
jgi:hypothetical protein